MKIHNNKNDYVFKFIHTLTVKVVGGAKGFLWGTLVLVMYLSDHKSN